MFGDPKVSSKRRIFILSPAKTTGKRAELLYNPRASFDMAIKVRDGGAPIGEVFSFLSGLYFRGKLAYANQFARPDRNCSGVWVITSNRGIVPQETVVTTADLLSFKEIAIDPSETTYVESLKQSALELTSQLPATAEVVLLGSISSNKYVELLLRIFGDRLMFPSEFLGRGDMSRGGLMLRCVASGSELDYIPLMGAVRHGKRPPKLEPLRRKPRD